MRFPNSYQMSESRLVGWLLAIVGGGLDAYTYLCRGHVFANAETGNIVLLALRLSERNWRGAVTYLIPILAFALGVLAAELIRHHLTERLHWRQYVVLFEIAVLCIVGYLPQGDWDMLANTLVAFACALQLECFRKVRGTAVATTMCTGNLRSGTEFIYLFFKNKDRALLRKSLEYYFIDLLFIVGAMFSGLISNWLGSATVFVFTVPLLLAFFLLFAQPERH